MTVPGPDLVSPLEPVKKAENVSVAAGLFWMKIRSAPLPDLRRPPVMVVALAPTLLVTRMPPVAIVRSLPIVTVEAPELESKRSELMVMNIDGLGLVVPEVVTLAPAVNEVA